MIPWLAASSPLIVLLLALMRFKLGAKKSGFLAWILALLVAALAFGGHCEVLFFASLKGASLTLYVVTIIWASTLMFRLVNETGLFPLVSEYMVSLTKDRLTLGFLIAWCSSGIIQGIAGYGVPVAVCAPLMIAAGFAPLEAAAAVLVGHSWSVTFGSMGSSYHALTMSTGLSAEALGTAVGLGFILPITFTGLCVAHIIGGWKGISTNWIQITALGLLMGMVQWVAARSGLEQVAALMASVSGAIAITLTSRKKPMTVEAPRSTEWGSHLVQRNKRGLLLVLSPYLTLLLLAAIGQAAKQHVKHLSLGFTFPATITDRGFKVAAEKSYAAIGLFTHPAPLILLATLITLPILMGAGYLDRQRIGKALRATVHQCLPTSLGILTMVMMALVMMDTGMTSEMAQGVAAVAGLLFPLVSPFIGVLGCFMTGSNTNSNVLFGAFQTQTAKILCISPLIAATAQTIGASLGSAIAPAKVFLGSSTAGLGGREPEVLRRSFWYCILTTLLVGVQGLVFALVMR